MRAMLEQLQKDKQDITEKTLLQPASLNKPYDFNKIKLYEKSHTDRDYATAGRNEYVRPQLRQKLNGTENEVHKKIADFIVRIKTTSVNSEKLAGTFESIRELITDEKR